MVGQQRRGLRYSFPHNSSPESPRSRSPSRSFKGQKKSRSLTGSSQERRRLLPKTVVPGKDCRDGKRYRSSFSRSPRARQLRRRSMSGDKKAKRGTSQTEDDDHKKQDYEDDRPRCVNDRFPSNPRGGGNRNNYRPPRPFCQRGRPFIHPSNGNNMTNDRYSHDRITSSNQISNRRRSLPLRGPHSPVREVSRIGRSPLRRSQSPLRRSQSPLRRSRSPHRRRPFLDERSQNLPGEISPVIGNRKQSRSGGDPPHSVNGNSTVNGHRTPPSYRRHLDREANPGSSDGNPISPSNHQLQYRQYRGTCPNVRRGDQYRPMTHPFNRSEPKPFPFDLDKQNPYHGSPRPHQQSQRISPWFVRTDNPGPIRPYHKPYRQPNDRTPGQPCPSRPSKTPSPEVWTHDRFSKDLPEGSPIQDTRPYTPSSSPCSPLSPFLYESPIPQECKYRNRKARLPRRNNKGACSNNITMRSLRRRLRYLS